MNQIGKKLINNVDDCVDESLQGFSFLYPGLELDKNHRFICKSQEKVTAKVGILSGGGSGHEPFSAGYVGNGMLSGSVSGSVFASPPKANILYAIRYLSSLYKGGVIVIIPNYTGDCLNFGMAIEQAKAECLNVTSMPFGEDCASGFHSIAGRRGMCGIILAYKICGGLSSNKRDITYIMNSLDKIHANVSTLGISILPCSLPGQSPLFTIADDYMELGTGVHGEAGIKKIKLTTAKETVKIILDKLCENLKLIDGCSVVVLVNNLGASSQLEQNIICYEVYQQLCERKHFVQRIYSGMCFTSLDMAGFQISILHLPKEHKEEWLQELDRDTDSPAWTGSVRSIPVEVNINKEQQININIYPKKNSIYKLSPEQQTLFKKCLEAASYRLIESETKLNDLDKGCGDGDCGTTLKNLAQGALENLKAFNYIFPEQVLDKLSEISESKMGGTSGAIYSLCFTAMAKCFTISSENSIFIAWVNALDEGVNTVMKYCRAQMGDRTIIDAFKPATEVMNLRCVDRNIVMNEILKESLLAAKKGCDSTKSMKARAGRASYVSSDYLTNVDAGAYGFVMIFEAVITILISQ